MLMPAELRKALSDDYKSISRPCSARQERTIGKRPENDGVYEEFVWGINILMKNEYTKSLTCNHCALKGQLFHSPGHRPGYKLVMTTRPVRAAVIIPHFYSCPYRARCSGFVSVYPGRLPWAVEAIGLSARPCNFHLQPVLAMPICIPSLSYPFALIAKHIPLVIFDIIQFQKLPVFILE